MQKVHKVQEGLAPPSFLHFLHFLQATTALGTRRRLVTENAKALAARRERVPDRREHALINFTTTDGFRYTAGLGYFENGRLAEIFFER